MIDITASLATLRTRIKAALDKQKAGIELNAQELATLGQALTTKLAASDYTAADVLEKLLTVDGAGSGLDADTLHGKTLSEIEQTRNQAIQEAVSALVASSPETLDTLSELAEALGNDPDFATTISNQIGTKLAASEFNADNILALLKTVHGAGSGLDAATVGGKAAGDLATAEQGAKADSAVQQAAHDLKVDIASIVNNLQSTSADKPLSAEQGRVLKSYIDNLSAILTSSDSDLDELQEIVDFIKINREALDSLSISAIAGLSAALDGKLGANETAKDSAMLGGVPASSYLTVNDSIDLGEL